MSKQRKIKIQSRMSSSNSGSSTPRLPDNFNPDYSYVKQDLRNIGILAGIFIAFLVILSFFI
ncbi:MAG: hypothetical protein JSV42_09505 [Chloroflexota bacterium]|nr:MAG: hypothetical protein JSV42_09505 [Chloroflexota bacterium]